MEGGGVGKGGEKSGRVGKIKNHHQRTIYFIVARLLSISWLI
jgi:hypothetical protein